MWGFLFRDSYVEIPVWRFLCWDSCVEIPVGDSCVEIPVGDSCVEIHVWGLPCGNPYDRSPDVHH